MRYLLALVVCLLVAAPAATAAETQILYSVDARDAAMAQSGKTIRLSMPANARVTWFTDRPERRAGTINLKALADIWSASGFDEDPPNAALILTHEGAERTHVVELIAPRFARGRVSFALRPIRNGSEAGHRHADPLAPGRYGHAALFIDDAAVSPCGGQIAVRNALPKPGSTPTPPQASTTTTVLAQCLLPPLGSVTVSAPGVGGSQTVVWACAQTAQTYTNIGSAVLTPCQSGVGFGSDNWLASFNNGACTTATGRYTVGNGSTAATIRVTVTSEIQLCTEEVYDITNPQVGPTTT